jgi:hypothetical protein
MSNSMTARTVLDSEWKRLGWAARPSLWVAAYGNWMGFRDLSHRSVFRNNEESRLIFSESVESISRSIWMLPQMPESSATDLCYYRFLLIRNLIGTLGEGEKGLFVQRGVFHLKRKSRQERILVLHLLILMSSSSS